MNAGIYPAIEQDIPLIDRFSLSELEEQERFSLATRIGNFCLRPVLRKAVYEVYFSQLDQLPEGEKISVLGTPPLHNMVIRGLELSYQTMEETSLTGVNGEPLLWMPDRIDRITPPIEEVVRDRGDHLELVFEDRLK
jgi:hypothetical protein